MISPRPQNWRTAEPGQEQGLPDPSRPYCLVILYFVLSVLLHSLVCMGDGVGGGASLCTKHGVPAYHFPITGTSNSKPMGLRTG